MHELGVPDAARRPTGRAGASTGVRRPPGQAPENPAVVALPPGTSPARALALQRAVGNAAFARALAGRPGGGRTVQRAPEILFPRDRERIRQPDYTIRLRPDPDTDNMRVDVDNAGFAAARPASGSWWFDWSGFGLGQHTITAEAWNVHGHRQVTPPRPVFGIAGTPVTVTNVGAAQVVNGRVEAVITYQAGPVAATATLNVSHSRHLVDTYVAQPDAKRDADITTLVDAPLATFLGAFGQYAQLIAQAMAGHGLALRPSAPEFELATAAGYTFHSDTLYVGSQVHCFPTTGPAALVTVLNQAEYIDFKHLMRAFSYVTSGAAAGMGNGPRATARSRALAALPLLAARPEVAAIFQRRGIANALAYQANVTAHL